MRIETPEQLARKMAEKGIGIDQIYRRRKLRQDQINKMPKGSDRDGLVNELDNYKRARERMLKV